MNALARRAALGAAAGLAGCLVALSAQAHDVPLSCSDFAVEPDGAVRAQLVFSRAEAIRLAGTGREGDALPSGAETNVDRDALRRRVTGGVAVTSDGQPCAGETAASADDAPGSFGVSLAFRCKPPAVSVGVELSFVDDLPADAHHLLQVREGDHSVSTIVSRSRRSATLVVQGPADGGPSRGAVVRGLLDALPMGVEHILTGWDHLLFLAALVLGTETLRAMVGTISAFTVAHSITLALAALGAVAPSARWVEPAIAASIVCVAAENLLRARRANRWPVAFAFGLVHGFGFAGALQGLALDRGRLLPTLVGFNAGVELGQLAVLAAVLPLLGALRKNQAFEVRWSRRVSASIGAIGAVLLVTRIWRP